MEEFTNTQSKYNEAMLQIQRLHDCWTKANNSARTGKFLNWKWELDIIWRELYSDIHRLEKKKVGEFIEAFRPKQSETIQELNDELMENIKNSIGREFYYALDKRHQFLKMLQDKVGKGAKFVDSNEEDFE